jgi:hypothetical protein
MRMLGSLQRLLPPAVHLLPRGLAGQATSQILISNAGAADTVDQRPRATTGFAWGLESRLTTFAPQEWLAQTRHTPTSMGTAHFNVGLAELA